VSAAAAAAVVLLIDGVLLGCGFGVEFAAPLMECEAAAPVRVLAPMTVTVTAHSVIGADDCARLTTV
jgi:hypothetical protein